MNRYREPFETRLNPLRRRLLIASILLTAGGLAFHSLLRDSLTYDELAHLTAGMSLWKTGDYRLQLDHPPLAKLWATLPLLAMEQQWPGPDTPGWLEGDVWQVGRTWLYRLNDAERLLLPARLMMLSTYLGTCLAIYALSRRIFGTPAALISLALAAFCPNMAAHGRLVTIDMPLTFCAILSLLAYARLLEKFTGYRVVVAGLALAILALIKSTWLCILPALLVMASISFYQRRREALQQDFDSDSGKRYLNSSMAGRQRQFLVIIVVSGALTWSAIWAAYGFQFGAFRGDDADRAVMARIGDPGHALPATMAESWETILHDSSGNPRTGLTAWGIRFAKNYHLFPEAMLYGMAHTLKFTESPPCYFMGEIYRGGRVAYFPVAFAIKTPVGTQVLLLLGISALVWRKARARDPIALLGLLTFAAIVVTVAMAGHFNIGLRHILPTYPAVFVLAGASAAWLASRPGRWVVGASLAWVVAANLWIHPHYLSYFNELVGGPRNGHKYLADSNIDWGQDLKRLSEYAKAHADESIRLAYFGSADPKQYGITQMLPSSFPFGESTPLRGGTYVVSVNQLLAVLVPTATDEFWSSPENINQYSALARALASPPPPDATDSYRQQRHSAMLRYVGLRYSRILQQLRHRKPDQRIGYTLFVYRLTDNEVAEILRPPS